jgi:glycosyltransferase involved in cell wall biosynthesis
MSRSESLTRPRVLFASTMWTSPWGGSEELWAATADRLAASGAYNVQAYVHHHTPLAPRICQLRDRGVTLHHYSSAPAIGYRLLKRILRRKFFRYFEKAIANSRPDLIVVSSGFSLPSADIADLLPRLGVPYVLLGQANADGWAVSDAELDLFRTVVSHASLNAFVSHGNRLLLQTQLAMDIPRSVVVRNPYNVSYDNDVPSLEDTASAPRFACVGRLEFASKGQDILIEVLGTDKWRSRPWSLTFYGAGGNERALRDLVRLRGIDNRVTFRGHVENIEDVWRREHALLLPSRHEGLPLAIVEALLCGRIVVTTDVAGNAELFRHGTEGFVAAAPTVKLFDAALEEAVSQRRNWPSISRAAREAGRRGVPQNAAEAFEKLIVPLIGTCKVI